jgi:hypothetical protein
MVVEVAAVEGTVDRGAVLIEADTVDWSCCDV